MYPTFFRVGSFEVTSFGVMVAIGALIGLWVFGRELARSGLPASAADAAMAGVFGGLVGAKLLWVAEHVGQEPFRDLLFSRGGMSWFGGLVGGVGTAVIVMKWQRLPLVPTLAVNVPSPTANVTCKLPLPASTSAIEIPVPDNVKFVCSLTLYEAVVSAIVGASFTAVTATVVEITLLSTAPSFTLN